MERRLTDGGGTVSTETGVLNNAQYGFKSRFETGPGTNPEELIGAAHAGCFSMAFSLILGNAGLKADYIKTEAAVSLEKVGDGFEITKFIWTSRQRFRRHRREVPDREHGQDRHRSPS
jgi:osmotically inducible protein OsmC